MLTDIEIAQSVTPKNILEIAACAGIDEKYDINGDGHRYLRLRALYLCHIYLHIPYSMTGVR